MAVGRGIAGTDGAASDRERKKGEADKVIDPAYGDKIKEEMQMTLVGQLLMEEGREKGEERLGKLNLILMDEKRYDDLEKVLKDKEYRKQLYAQYGI